MAHLKMVKSHQTITVNQEISYRKKIEIVLQEFIYI
jgi:hypothetical protein